MLEQILQYLNNWFVADIKTGSFTVRGGSITLPSLLPGQYFRIIGSVFNDGLHTSNDQLHDESFDGSVWLLAVPKSVVSISEEIAAWTVKNRPSAYTSESFGGYSYTRGTNGKGLPAGWQEVFASTLAPWKKLRETCMVQPNPKGTPPLPHDDGKLGGRL